MSWPWKSAGKSYQDRTRSLLPWHKLMSKSGGEHCSSWWIEPRRPLKLGEWERKNMREKEIQRVWLHETRPIPFGGYNVINCFVGVYIYIHRMQMENIQVGVLNAQTSRWSSNIGNGQAKFLLLQLWISRNKTEHLSDDRFHSVKLGVTEARTWFCPFPSYIAAPPGCLCVEHSN